jgi:tRNA (guanine37-N1)-methyltransferase
MTDKVRFSVLAPIVEILKSPLEHGMIKRAIQDMRLEVSLIPLRKFAKGAHSAIDDKPYGGGAGMVLSYEPIKEGINYAKKRDGKFSGIYLLTPSGELFNQTIAREMLVNKNNLLICGRYEGFDERVKQIVPMREISLGDYVISGGELAAAIIIDAVSRLIPDVLGNPLSLTSESFSDNLLDYPSYTRPDEVDELTVPEVLLSGDHKLIAKWRHAMRIIATIRKRPDLKDLDNLNDKERELVEPYLKN